MKYKIMAGVLSLGLVGCAGGAVKVGSGQGEFANIVKTKVQQVELESHINNNYKAYGRIDSRSSEKGAIDDKNHSLIDVDELMMGLGVHTYSLAPERSEARLLVNDQSYLIELEDKRLVMGNFGVISGLSHRNRWESGRKTTGAKVGVYFRRWKKTDYMLAWHIRNNTLKKTDDYLLFGVTRRF